MASVLHSYHNGQHTGSLKVLPSSVKIHGIRIVEVAKNHCACLIFGSKYIQMVTVDMASGEITSVNDDPIQFTDWIKDATMIKENVYDNYLLYLVFAHNFVQKWKVSLGNDEISVELVDESVCDERCLLYAAKLFFLPGYREPLVISGTVFTQMLVWNPFGSEKGLKKRLTGHEGVIFNIDADIDNQYLLLASVSDDRTVRFWKLRLSDFELEFTRAVFGHTARVWDVKFLSNTNQFSNTNQLLSCSEDSTIRLWDMVSGKCLNSWDLFKADCWCIGIKEDQRTVIAGGSAGEIATFELESSLSPVQSVYDCGTNVRYCVLFTRNLVLYFMKTGELKVFDIDTLQFIETAHLEINCINFHSKTLLYGELSYICLMNDKNEIGMLMHDGEKLKYETILCLPDHRVYDVHLKYENDELFMILHSFNNDCNIIDIYRLSTSDISAVVDAVSLEYPIRNLETRSKSLQKCPSSSIKSIGDDYFILAIGGYFGQILLFVLSFKTHTCVASFDTDNIHCSQTVTDLMFDSKKSGLLYSCGRDGSVVKQQVQVILEQPAIKSQFFNRLKLTKGWLEKFINSNHVIALQDRTVVLYDIKNPCEGRAVSVQSSKNGWNTFIDGEKILIYHMNRGKLYVEEKSVEGNNRLISAYPVFHHMQTRCIRTFNFSKEASLLVTAGDDSFIMLYIRQSNSFRHIYNIKKHGGSIPTLAFLEVNATEIETELLLFSGGAKEEVFVSKLQFCRIDGKWVFVDYIEVAQCPNICFIRDTRIMNMSVIKFNDIFLVGILYSDGCFRLWNFNLDERKFFVIGTLELGRSCPLRVRAEKQHNQCIFYITDTGGFVSSLVIDHDTLEMQNSTGKGLELCLRDIQISDKPIRMQKQRKNSLDSLLSCKLKAHKSGINALDVIQYSGKSLVATGGDDGAIALLFIKNYNNITIAAQNELAHGSTVTAISFVEAESELLLLSASIDQWLCLWRYDDMSKKLEFVKRYRLDIADISGMQVISTQNQLEVYVIGFGLQMITIDTMQNKSNSALKN